MKRFLGTSLLALSLGILPWTVNAQSATFTVTASGTNPVIDSAIMHTVRIWEHHLVSTQPIKLNIFYWDLTTFGPLGITFPNGRRDFAGAPIDSVWYPTSLANALSSSETNPGESDIDVYMNANTDISWYFGTDANPSIGQYDFVSVLLHEIGHGLGFLSLGKTASGTGCVGCLLAADFFPLAPTFPWPDLQGKPSVYDYYIETTAGDRIADTTLFPNPGTELDAAFTSNGLWFDAPISFSENSSVRVRLHAPNTFALGTSVTHLNETTFPSSHPSTLMTPFISKGETNHGVGDLTLAILEDLGWSVDYTVDVASEAKPQTLQAFPNPFQDALTIRHEGSGRTEISIIDAEGRVIHQEVMNANGATNWNWSGKDDYGREVPAGIYMVRVVNESGMVVKKVMKSGRE